MIKYILVSGLLFYAINSFGQIKGDYVWQIGLSSNSSNNPYPLSMEISFSAKKVTIDTFYRPITLDDINASIADEEGRMLAYSNGCQISNGEHRLIPGTKSLNPGSVDFEYCIVGNFSYPARGSGLFLSFYNDSILLLLHQRLKIEGPPTHVYVDSLYYTTIRREGDSYVLLDKTVPIAGDYLTGGNVEAVKSTRPGAWWVIQGERASNRYFSILLDSARVDTIFTQTIGDTTYRGGAAGQAVFSPDGSMYARYNPLDDLFLFDFDRATGLLSNYRKMHVADSGNIGGLAFSPNGRFLYACARLDMYQFDTWAEDIEASKVHLGHFDNHFDPFPATFYHMQLGPDCRIYIGSSNGVKAMHLIHEPDKKGLDCRFEQYAFHFPVHNSITMPNFPNYRLDIAPVCDPDIVTGFRGWFPPSPTPVELYPVPTDGLLWIRLSEIWDPAEDIMVQVVGQTGQKFMEKKALAQNGMITLDLESLTPGIYFVTIQSQERWFTGRIVRM